jgi:hypothetical protein
VQGSARFRFANRRADQQRPRSHAFAPQQARASTRLRRIWLCTLSARCPRCRLTTGRPCLRAARS